MRKILNHKTESLILGLMIFLAFALQIQMSLFVTESYKGLCLGLADIVLPFAGLYILYSLIKNQSYWPQFNVPYACLWLSGMGGILLLALVNTYHLYDQLSHWGLINKIVGWAILCSYFLLGGWLVQKITPRNLILFLKVCVWFFIVTASVYCFLMVLKNYKIIQDHNIVRVPITGFIGNKNTFIFFGLIILSVLCLLYKSVFSEKTLYYFSFLIPFIFMYTAARAGLIVFIVVLVLLILIKRKLPWFKMALCSLFAVMLLCVVHYTAPTKKHFYQYKKNLAAIQHVHSDNPDKIYKGDNIRVQVLDTTKNMIAERPILGSGLGAARIEQTKQYGRFIDIIDCTPLWLWAEMGIVGLSVFLLFYVLCLRGLWRGQKRLDIDPVFQKFIQLTLMSMIIFGLMSLFHEILYTRFLWFFMGLGLGLAALKPNSAISK